MPLTLEPVLLLKFPQFVSAPLINLNRDECRDAQSIQAALDQLGVSGGVVQLPELDLTLDRGLELHTGIELRGCGARTILRKGTGRAYAFSGYHNYGMRDVPLINAAGLAVGMTVTIFDEKKRGFDATFARITWIEGNWVGLDRGVESDYCAEDQPQLVTNYPLIFGRAIRRAAVRNLTLDGNLADNPQMIDGCRNGAVYFDHCHEIEITDIAETKFNGEGLSFQLCSQMLIRDCTFSHNAGNGLHPGAGSTNVLFEQCRSAGNGANGFFFCVRANHVTMRGCTFGHNHKAGVSIGTRDCHNLIEDCAFSQNAGPGIHFRPSPRPVEVHSCRINRCQFMGNAEGTDRGQIEILDAAHDIVIEDCTFAGDENATGVTTSDQVTAVYLERNRLLHGRAEMSGAGFTRKRPEFSCSAEDCLPCDYRHLTI